MARCLGYPKCTGTMEGNAHVPSCPEYVATEEIKEPWPVAQAPEQNTLGLSLFIVQKVVVAKDIAEAIQNESKGKIISVQQQS